MTDGTKTTVSGANVAEDEDCGCAATPAVAPIGTIGVGADGLQAVNFEGVVGVLEGFAGADAAFKPMGEPRGGFICWVWGVVHDAFLVIQDL